MTSYYKQIKSTDSFTKIDSSYEVDQFRLSVKFHLYTSD